MKTPILLQCFLIVFCSMASGAISNYVPPILPNTDYVDRIEAYGCSARTFRAFQPQSHADLLEALMVYADAECLGPEWLLDEREILGRSYLQSEARVFALLSQNTALSLIGQEATVDPFLSLREGRQVFGGSHVYTELNLNSQLINGKDWGVAVSATPGFVMGHENSESFRGKFYFQDGYIKAGYGRTEWVFGRVSQRFGEAKYGNLILSGAHKPLDLVKFSVRPHWIKPLSVLGPVAFESWWANDGSTLGKKNARLWGVQLGMRPFTFFEWGILNLMQFGGSGEPSLGVGDYLKMLIASTDPQLVAKRHQSFATHLAFWGPKQFAKLYNQLFFGSLGRVEDWFSRDISWLVGLWFPKVGEGDIRLEWVNTQQNAYSDVRWTQGWTYSGTPLGHPLGNSGQGIYLDYGLPMIANWRPEVGVSYERRNVDRLKGQEAETRLSLSVGAVKRFQALELDLQAKVQEVTNRDFVRSEKEWEGGGLVYLRYSFL